MDGDLQKSEIDDDPLAGGRHLHIDTLNYHGNDLRELRKIAELNPQLAEKLADQKAAEGRREHASYRMGLLGAIGMVAMVLSALSFILYNIGILAALVSIGVILASALFVRAILTGEWSETTWVGKIVDGLTRGLGGKPATTSDDEASEE